MTVEEYAAALIETFGGEPYPGAALERAQATYDFCDHNEDGKACVMLQTFPATVFTIVDNHPYGGN
jgi:hypothetical protein